MNFDQRLLILASIKRAFELIRLVIASILSMKKSLGLFLGQYYVMLPNSSDSRLPQIVPGGARGSSGTMTTVYSNDLVLGGSNRIQNQRLPTVSPIVSTVLTAGCR